MFEKSKEETQKRKDVTIVIVGQIFVAGELLWYTVVAAGTCYVVAHRGLR